MHCSQCGQLVAPGARFCSNCGATVAAPAYGMPARTLVRPRHGRMIGGVCAAIARAYGWNVTLLRVLLVVLTPLHLGVGFLAYIAAWIFIPEEPYLLPAAPPPPPPATL